jgi:hypothetical protein
MNSYPISDFSDIGQNKFTLTRTGERFIFLEQLKKCCLFGSTGVLTAFSNAVLHVDTPLPIGRIQILNFADKFSPEIIERGLEIIGTPLYAAVNGNVDKGECVFPDIQHQSATQINIAATAFPHCPPDFAPQINTDIYFAFRSADHAIQLLHKSLLELSKNRANFAIVLLYTAIEAATYRLTGDDSGKVSGRLYTFSKKVENIDNNSARTLRRLKKQIERRIVEQRGIFAHKGQDVTQTDLLPSYETAVEFFWYYSDFKRLSSEVGIIPVSS